MTDEERTEFLRIRKEAGLKIDPETAEVEWIFALVPRHRGFDSFRSA